MISTRTFELFGYMVRLGYVTRLLPCKWDPKKRRLSRLSRKRNRQYKYFTFFCMALQVALVAYYIFTILVFDVPFYEIAVAGILIVAVALSTCMSALILTAKTQAIFAMNGIFSLNELQMTHFKLKECARDGVSRVLAMFASTGVSMMVLTGPAILVILNMNWKMAWLIPYIPLPCTEIWVTLFLDFLCFVTFFTFVIVEAPIFLAAQVLMTGMKKNVCETKNPSEGIKLTARHLYRVQYILYRTAEEVFYYGVPPFVALGAFGIIATLYTLMAMYTALDIWVIGALVLLISLQLSVTYVGPNICNQMTANSLDYFNSYKSMDENMSKYDKAYYRSFRPMVWHIGNFSDINNDFFPMFMEFIVGKVIDLFLAYKYE